MQCSLWSKSGCRPRLKTSTPAHGVDPPGSAPGVGFDVRNPQLIARVLYGSGLRLMECLRLRVKDLDFTYHQIIVHDGIRTILAGLLAPLCFSCHNDEPAMLKPATHAI
jgi:hypothetical protein